MDILIREYKNRDTATNEHLVIYPHALNHGVTDEEIEYAWTHYILSTEREPNEFGEIRIVRIGPRNQYSGIDGEPTEGYDDFVGIVAVRKEYGYLIAHAKIPPINSIIEEIEQARRSQQW